MLIGVVVLLVLALGAGVFYMVNGGWQTEAQKKWQFEHVEAPIAAARRGRPEMLEEENKRRQAAGQPPLKVMERHENAQAMRGKLQDLQGKFRPAEGASTGQ